MDTAALDARWHSAWGSCRPISHELRGCLHDRWVRFHSLPGSQRYAVNDDEYAELLHRHATVLAELLQSGETSTGQELVLLTASWSSDPEPAERAAELAQAVPTATYWTSVLTDDSEPEPVWTHLWLSPCRLRDAHLTQLLRLVADDTTDGVIITTPEMSWLYAPYDGGADVIVATAVQRDQLRERHQDWLSAHPAGL